MTCWLSGHDCYVKTFVLGWYLFAVRHSVAVVDCFSNSTARKSSIQDGDIGLERVKTVEEAALGQDGLPACFGTTITVLSLLLDRPHGPRSQQVLNIQEYVWNSFGR